MPKIRPPGLPLAEALAFHTAPEPNANGCRLWASTLDNGYGRLKYRGELYYAHRVAFECNGGTIPPGGLVLHHCATPACLNPAHLYIGTAIDSAAGRDARNTQPRGEANGRARLTLDAAEAIRSEFAAGGVAQITLARRYGMSKAAISLLIAGKTWAQKKPAPEAPA